MYTPFDITDNEEKLNSYLLKIKKLKRFIFIAISIDIILSIAKETIEIIFASKSIEKSSIIYFICRVNILLLI